MKVKPGTEFRKLFKAVRERFGLANSTITFVFDGNVIKDTDTPRLLSMEEDDQIDIVETY